MMSRPKLRHNQLIYLLLLTLVTIAASQSSHQQHFSHAPTNEDTSRAFNLTELLITRFPYLFKDITIPNLSSENQNDSSNYQSINHNNDTNHQQQQQQPQSTLENRKIDQPPSGRPTILSNEASFRNYFRILDKVFSRVTLPEVYRSSRSKLGAHCGLHIGCLEELPNFPALLKKANITSTYTLYSGDKASRAGHKIHYEPITHYQLQDAYTSEIDLEEKLRAIQRANLAATQQQQQQLLKNNRRTHHHHHVGGNRLSMIQKQQRQQLHSLNPLIHAAAAATQPLISPKLTAHSWRSATKILHSQEYPFDLASLESSGFNASQNTRVIIGGYFAKEDEEWIDEVVRQWLILEPQSNVIKVSWAEANRGLYHTAAYNSRIVGRQMSLFLHYLDQLFNINLNKFHLVGHSLGAHIAGFVGSDFDGRIARITGLDPAGPIFVELNASMRLDPSDSKFVDVMHTNGGTITKGSLGLSIPSGHVDYYCNGGSVQPGCYFSSVTKSIMDPVERIACNHRRSYRYFLEIIKMTIRATQNSDTFGISQPVDQVSKQATVITTNSTLDSNLGEFSDDDRLVAARRQVDCDDDTCSSEELSPKTVTINRSLPSAFLFEAKQDDLVRLIQPEISLMRADLGSNEDQLPVRRHIEFHLLNPTFPPGKRGTYFFKTRSEAPFFATKQYALTLRTDTIVKRKIALSAKINQTIVAEVELDEIPGSYSLVFAPNDLKQGSIGAIASVDLNSPPTIQLMWKYRSFNLLLNQQNELHLASLELTPLELDDQVERQPNFVVRYSASQSSAETPPLNSISSLIGQAPAALPSAQSIVSAASSSSSHSSTTLQKGGLLGAHLTLTRNQWHKFEGKAVRP